MGDLEAEEFNGTKSVCCGAELQRDDDYPDFIGCSECGMASDDCHDIKGDSDKRGYCFPVVDTNAVNSELVENLTRQVEILEAKLKSQEWVSVETASPDDKQECIAISEGVRIIATYWSLTGKWLISDTRLANNAKVTHWQRLPEPPKEAKQ